jgi:hypothetical protein
MGRSIKIVRQLEQVFEPYRMMFKELKGGGREEVSPRYNVSAKKRKTLKDTVTFSSDFRFARGRGVLRPNPAKAMDECI